MLLPTKTMGPLSCAAARVSAPAATTTNATLNRRARCARRETTLSLLITIVGNVPSEALRESDRHLWNVLAHPIEQDFFFILARSASPLSDIASCQRVACEEDKRFV